MNNSVKREEPDFLGFLVGRNKRERGKRGERGVDYFQMGPTLEGIMDIISQKFFRKNKLSTSYLLLLA